MAQTNKAPQKDIGYWRQRALSAELSNQILKAQLARPPLPQTPHDHGREINALVERLNAIESSRSWKITAPLRNIVEVLLYRRGPTVKKAASIHPNKADKKPTETIEDKGVTKKRELSHGSMANAFNQLAGSAG